MEGKKDRKGEGGAFSAIIAKKTSLTRGGGPVYQKGGKHRERRRRKEDIPLTLLGKRKGQHHPSKTGGKSSTAFVTTADREDPALFFKGGC